MDKVYCYYSFFKFINYILFTRSSWVFSFIVLKLSFYNFSSIPNKILDGCIILSIYLNSLTNFNIYIIIFKISKNNINIKKILKKLKF